MQIRLVHIQYWHLLTFDFDVPFWNVILTLPLFPLLILLLSQAIWPQRNSPIEEVPGDSISLEAFFLDLLSH